MTHGSKFSASSVTVDGGLERGQSGMAVNESNAISVDTLASGAFDEAPASDIGFFGISSITILVSSKL